MTQEMLAGATALSGGSASPAALEPLPERSRSLAAADFERLLSQAQSEQAVVEMGNPQVSAASQSVSSVTQGIASSSRDYRSAVDAGLSSLSKLDMKDPASFGNVMQHFTNITVQSVQLGVVLGEVTSAKKSVTELFHNQG